MSVSRYLLVSALVAGCAHGGNGGGEVPQFPSPTEIDKLRTSSPPSRIANPSLRDVETWTLKDAPAHSPGSALHTPASPWEQLLADAAKSRQGLLWTSEAMHCLAQQYGQFYLSEGGIPGIDLSEFMAARCGVTDTELGSFFNWWKLTGPATDDQLFAKSREELNNSIQKQLASGSQVAGIWYGRSGERAVVMVAYAPRRVRFDAVPFVPEADGHMRLRGEVLVPAEHVNALINYGHYGFKECAMDPTLRLPRFGLDCETNHDDPAAALEIGVFPPGRLTGRVVSRLLVWPSGTAGDKFARSSYGVEMHAPVGPGLPQSLTSLLNDVRKAAGLSAVELNTAESATATSVAPHYFAALAGGESEAVVDTVVLGLRAGWQIPGFVGYGQFTSSMNRETNDAGHLLASALDRPSGRETLLDPAARVIAIGPVLSRSEGILGAVFSAYSFLEPSGTAEEVNQVMRLLAARRKEKGRSTPGLARKFQAAVTQAARRIESGQEDPHNALQNALQDSSNTMGPVQGWLLTTDKFERLTFPDTLIDSPSLMVAVAVAHYKPEGSPWAMRGVLIVASGSQGSTVASSGHKTVALRAAGRAD